MNVTVTASISLTAWLQIVSFHVSSEWFAFLQPREYVCKQTYSQSIFNSLSHSLGLHHRLQALPLHQMDHDCANVALVLHPLKGMIMEYSSSSIYAEVEAVIGKSSAAFGQCYSDRPTFWWHEWQRADNKDLWCRSPTSVLHIGWTNKTKCSVTIYRPMASTCLLKPNCKR